MNLKTFLTILFQLLEYLEESENRSYEEYISDGGKPQDHIYHNAKKMRRFANKLQRGYIGGSRHLFID